MASSKLSALVAATALSLSDLIYISQGGVSKSATVQNVSDLLLAGGPGGYATRALMAAAAAPTVGQVVQLGEPGRVGAFFVALASAWSAAITADTTQQGAFVVSTSDATKVYVRLDAIVNATLNVRHFGAVLDNSTDDHAAISGAVATSYAMRRAASISGVEYGNGGGPAVLIPGFGYMGANTLSLNHSFRLFGNNTGLPAGIVSGLRWANGVNGLTINDRPRVEGLCLIGGFAGTEGEYHAIYSNCTFQYLNLSGGNWSGDFMKLDCNGGVGNVDGVVGENVWVYNCRDALNNVSGANNSAQSHKNWNVQTCRRWGVDDNTFLGNSHDGHEIADCSLSVYNDGVSIGCSLTSYSGNRYFAIVGQEVWCSTHSPSGTSADNQGWAYNGAGGASPTQGIIAWFNGILVRAGGGYYIPGVNGGSTLVGCYTEGGQGLAQLGAVALGFSPNLGLWKGSSAVNVTSHNGYLRNDGGFETNGYSGTDETVKVQVGEKNASYKTIWQITTSVKYPLGLRECVDPLGGGDFGRSYNGGVLYTVETGPLTAKQFGTGAAVPFANYFSKLMIGADTTTARLMTNGTAAPTTGAHGQGEIVWNGTPAVGSPKGWMCTVAGTPGTWVSMGNL